MHAGFKLLLTKASNKCGTSGPDFGISDVHVMYISDIS